MAASAGARSGILSSSAIVVVFRDLIMVTRTTILVWPVSTEPVAYPHTVAAVVWPTNPFIKYFKCFLPLINFFPINNSLQLRT